MSLIPLTFSIPNHNSKLYFSKYELNLILSFYSFGVSKGNWKDYSINFNNNEAKFCFYKHTLVFPEFALTKYKKEKKNKFFYKLNHGKNNKKEMENFDKLIIYLKRINIKVVK